MSLTKVACPSCGVVLNSKAGIRSGQKIVCPKCQERFTAAAPASMEPEDEEPGHPPARSRSDAVVKGKPGPKSEKAPKRKPTPESDPDEEKPVAKAGKKRGKKVKRAASRNLLLFGLIGGVLVLAGGGIGLYFLLARNTSSGPSRVAVNPPDKRATDRNPGANPVPNRNRPKENPSDNPAFKELASRLTGRWEGMLEGGQTVLYDYRGDGTFSLEVNGGAGPVKAAGTWKVRGVGKNSGSILRTGEGDPSPYFKPNDTSGIWFQSDDRMTHQTETGPVVCFRDEPVPERTAEFLAAEAKAVALVQKLGGRLTRKLGRVDGPVIVINLAQTNVSDDDLALLAPLANLRELDLTFARITDAGLAHLKGMTSLRSLKLGQVPVTDAGLAHLKGMTKMVVLDLTGLPRITDQGLAELKGLTRLQFLRFSLARVTGTGLVHLKEMTQLVDLCVSGKDLRDEHLVYLKGLVDLQVLGLTDSAITDAGLNHLDGLNSLGLVFVDNTQIGDEGLARLARLPNMQTVSAIGSRVTEAGVQRVKANRPQLVVMLKPEPAPGP